MAARVFLLVFSVFFTFTSRLAFAQIFPSPYQQVEPSIAVNPTDPENIIVACINIDKNGGAAEKYVGVYYTFNRGSTWSGKDTLSGFGAADPVVKFNPDGVAFLLYQKSDLSDLYLRMSSDGGDTWAREVQTLCSSARVPHFDKRSNRSKSIRWLRMNLLLLPALIMRRKLQWFIKYPHHHPYQKLLLRIHRRLAERKPYYTV